MAAALNFCLYLDLMSLTNDALLVVRHVISAPLLKFNSYKCDNYTKL